MPRLKACGFEGVELWPQYLDQWGAERWAAALRANGMVCFQLCPYFNFVHGEEKIAVSRLILEEFLVAAQILECNKLRVFTGPPWGEGVVGAHEANESQWLAATAGLQEFCDRAPGVEFCLECHSGSLMEDALSTVRLIEGVNRSNLTVNLQLPLREEAWEKSLQILAPWTTHIHIHNWEDGLDQGKLTFLAEGAFDWRPVFDHLSKLNRTVCLSVEHGDHGGRHDPWETARRDGPWLCGMRRQGNLGPQAWATE